MRGPRRVPIVKVILSTVALALFAAVALPQVKTDKDKTATPKVSDKTGGTESRRDLGKTLPPRPGIKLEMTPSSGRESISTNQIERVIKAKQIELKAEMPRVGAVAS